MGSFLFIEIRFMSAQDKTFYWYLFHNDLVLLEKKDGGFTIPSGKQSPFPVENPLIISEEDKVIHMAGLAKEPLEETERYFPVGMRPSWEYLDDEAFRMVGKACELLYWHKHSHFCPACGTPTFHALPVMKKCPSCQFELYPVISTAILALVRKVDSVLLVRALNFKGPFHGLVAGFLETGESLEECAVREVKEETGLDICNVTYFGNQFWPFPSGLMVGFIADYAGGEIKIQEDELSSAAFYTRENLPELPGKLSLARKMVDWWIENPS